jgi:hypothetical protein
MAKTFTAPFAQTPKTATAVVTAAGTFVDDAPTNTQLLVTAGSDGCIVTSLAALPRATVTAAKLMLFLSKDSGTTKRFVDSALMSAYTSANTTATPVTLFASISEATPMRLEAGDQLYVGSAVALASGIVFEAQFTDF